MQIIYFIVWQKKSREKDNKSTWRTNCAMFKKEEDTEVENCKVSIKKEQLEPYFLW